MLGAHHARVAPRVPSNVNFRVPDLGVVCGGYDEEQLFAPEPVVLIESLSPGNESKTRSNVWIYATIPSVKEMAVFLTDKIGVELLRRGADDNWPETPEIVEAGDEAFETLGVNFPLAAAYGATRLAPEAPR